MTDSEEGKRDCRSRDRPSDDDDRSSGDSRRVDEYDADLRSYATTENAIDSGSAETQNGRPDVERAVTTDGGDRRRCDAPEDGDPFAVGSIFAREELLRVGYVPDRDRIIGRDDEIRAVGKALGPAVRGGPPRNLLLYGKTGTGKSLVSKHMAREAGTRATDNGVNLIYQYVDCSNDDTETRAARELALGVRDTLEPELSIPRKGIGAAEYFRHVWDLLDVHDVRSLIVILDEVDKLDGDDDILMTLSRAEESGKTDSYVGIIAISNKIQYRESMGERVDSSLQDREFVFHPYDATQLRQILENRRDAFQPDVLSADVIPKVAALAAREHGDARKAIDILRYAGAIAEESDSSQVLEEHIDSAMERAEADRFAELVSGSTPHVKYILVALASLTMRRDEEEFAKQDIYSTYKRVCANEGSDPISWDRVSRLLKEQSFLGITESRHTGGGYEKGSYRVHSLNRDPEIVLKALDSGAEL
ncbi:Cdc6/Cdc18 family protein [Haloprofundus salilacus]|uniref:Cdc6/Cdc18 family protein n=1 Tax=Haloprofundus salilacus TaxID=2876190 RepID=UPI001CCE4020|nr:orc1/cdc6 family replication initiation protein [Haloprofundus salilacus]